MDRKYLLTTGEFAKLCNTTKETLYYYKEKHIFEPAETGDNGYRYYTLDQLCEFDAISVLKQVGASIDEISSYLNDYNSSHFISLLNSKLKVLEKQEQRIRQMRQFIMHNYMLTSSALYQEIGDPKIEYCEEEYLIVTERKMIHSDPMDEMHDCLQDHLAYCNQIGLIDRYPLGDMVHLEDALIGSFDRPATISVVTNPTDNLRGSSRFHVKPAGRYLVYYVKGRYDYELFRSEYSTLISHAGQNDLKLASDIYEYDVLSYLATGDDDNYVRKYSVRIAD